MENIVIFYDHLEYFTAIWYKWPFGIVCGHLVYFFTFWYVWNKKNLTTLVWFGRCRFFSSLKFILTVYQVPPLQC
jgi:hypothetical protein